MSKDSPRTSVLRDNDLIQKGQDDLIRRGDALKVSTEIVRKSDSDYRFRNSGFSNPTDAFHDAINTIPAVQPTVSPDVAALVKAVIMLNAACDAMWNDHERLEKNPDSFGQKYRLRETHLRAISEAQQNLPLALARVKSKEGFSDEKGVM